MKKILLLLTILSFGVAPFAQKAFYNKHYKLQRKEIKIALIPFFRDDKLYTETIIESLSQDSLKKVRLADINKLVKNILTDTLLNESVRKIVTTEYSSSDLKHSPNLTQLIDANSMTYMKIMLDTADILLIPPAEIGLRTVRKQNGTGNTTVYGRFRLYDLNTGEFIFDFHAEKKVQYLISEDEIGNQMSVVLEDFYSYFYKYFIVKNNLMNK